MPTIKPIKYGIAQWRHDYMARGRPDGSADIRRADLGLTLGVVAMLVWLVAVGIEYLLLGGDRDAARIMFEAAAALTAVPMINIAIQFVLMFRSRPGRVPLLQLTSMLLAVPWMAIVVMEHGSLRALVAHVAIPVGH